ncbi:hypothetical protein EUX98_g5375 [Antrodiella citrinella]|uniref:Uncharacterized protein n=1 Tax=Antrodiella citrinella TaxID=2447956 RepID=A0A4S4MUG1_9APHY|nr:hypothetical protein EUX98_g5375 [Antrodiella citrinella]
MDVGPSIAVDLGPTYGAAFVGLVVEASIFGVTLLQTYDYYKNYSRDSLAMKWLVAALTLLDTLHLILCARTIYWYLVTNFGASAATLDEITWSMAGIIGVSVQIFFARRVWMMSRNWFLTILIVILGTIHFTQKRTGIARTDSLVTTLMIYSINTGLLTSILATFRRDANELRMAIILLDHGQMLCKLFPRLIEQPLGEETIYILALSPERHVAGGTFGSQLN